MTIRLHSFDRGYIEASISNLRIRDIVSFECQNCATETTKTVREIKRLLQNGRRFCCSLKCTISMKYEQQSKQCENCGKDIKQNLKFCSRSCACKVNNRKRKIVGSCLHCGKEVRKGGDYCSRSCFFKYKTNLLLKMWLSGEVVGYSGKTKSLKLFVRRYIFEVFGSACSICGWDEKHPVDGAILTEIDHIDGNAENCKLDNLRVLCPNCHSKTPTYRARNKNSKRNRKV